MKRYSVLPWAGFLVVAGLGAQPTALAAQAEEHVAAARAVAYRPGQDFTWVFSRLCFEPEPASATPEPARPDREAASGSAGPPPRSVWYTPPATVFDNLHYLGTRTQSPALGVAAWAVTTSDGIILFDAVFDYSVGETVDNGLRTLGLDPADIRYVVVSHGHRDHYGGARHLQDSYGARIVMSEVDWTVLANDSTPAELKPRRDMIATDGMELTLGDTTLRLYITPGHTPGTLSALIPLRDGDRTHLGTIWGGNNFGLQYFSDPADAFGTYNSAAKRYREIVTEAGADVFVSSHTAQDKTLDKINALRFRGPGDPHPFVSADAPGRHLTVLEECSAARLARAVSGR